jgi:hypothetical protein
VPPPVGTPPPVHTPPPGTTPGKRWWHDHGKGGSTAPRKDDGEKDD